LRRHIGLVFSVLVQGRKLGPEIADVAGGEEAGAAHEALLRYIAATYQRLKSEQIAERPLRTGGLKGPPGRHRSKIFAVTASPLWTWLRSRSSPRGFSMNPS
jgi:hypothetical protein